MKHTSEGGRFQFNLTKEIFFNHALLIKKKNDLRDTKSGNSAMK